MRRLSPIIQKAEIFIRDGEIRSAASFLHQIDISSAPSRFGPSLANLMRRCGMFSEALSLVDRVMRETKPGDRIYIQAMAEYCTVLIRLGGVEEAGLRLNTIIASKKHANEPAVLTARFWYHFTRYEYREAIPVLKNWLDTVREPYLKLIAENNLAEAFFGVGEYSKARLLINQSLSVSKSKGYLRLFANALHIRARCYSEAGEFDRSNEDLKRALGVLENAGTGDSSLLNRQLAINESLATSNLRAINKFRPLAIRAGLWESLRELDFQSLRVQFRAQVFRKLYFGTPYPAYRDRILAQFPQFRPESEYVWGPRAGPRLDLGSGQLLPPPGNNWVSPTPLNLLTLRALLRDAYRPIDTREIYAVLFPGEIFDSDRSDNRVHQNLTRLRKWFNETNLPLRIELQDRGYKLRHLSQPSIALVMPLVPRSKVLSKDTESFLVALKEVFDPSREFSAAEARQFIALSSATMIRRLKEAVNKNKLLRRGSGKNTRYAFVGH